MANVDLNSKYGQVWSKLQTSENGSAESQLAHIYKDSINSSNKTVTDIVDDVKAINSAISATENMEVDVKGLHQIGGLTGPDSDSANAFHISSELRKDAVGNKSFERFDRFYQKQDDGTYDIFDNLTRNGKTYTVQRSENGQITALFIQRPGHETLKYGDGENRVPRVHMNNFLRRSGFKSMTDFNNFIESTGNPFVVDSTGSLITKGGLDVPPTIASLGGVDPTNAAKENPAMGFDAGQATVAADEQPSVDMVSPEVEDQGAETAADLRNLYRALRREYAAARANGDEAAANEILDEMKEVRSDLNGR